MTAKTDARNITTAYNYDALNRVSTRSYSDGITPNVSYFYDNLPNAKGQMIKVSNGFSTTEYTQFDQMSRVAQSKQTTDGAAYTSSYAYNLAGALIEQTYPSGRVVKSTLDADGDLALVQSKRSGATNFSTYATNFTYTSAGAVSSMQLGNGRWESTAFNERLQPTQIALGTTPNATNLLKLNYEYGKLNWDGSTLAGTNNGNVSKQTVNVLSSGQTTGFVATQYYTYDALNRIEIASENLQPNDGSPLINGWRQNYSYDRYGNRRFIITGDSSTTTIPQGCADVVCNPTANQTNNRLDGYTYDDAGNTKIDATGRSFAYDAENKQTEVKDANNIVVGRYYYDGDGKRIKKVSNTETVIFVYDAMGKLIAEYSNQTNTAPQISYLTNDHLGSPRIITDGSGNVTSRRDFQPFGEEVRTWYRVPNLGYAVADDVRQKFTGYERDDESELDFAQARYFNSGFGRFSSPDDFLNDTHVSDPQSWNLYVYARNNPLKYNDPSGEIILNSDGTVKFDPDKVDKKTGKGKDSDFIYQQVEQKDGSIITYKWKAVKGSIYADNGKKVEAFKATTAVSAEVQRADGTIDKKQSQTLTASLSKADNSCDCHGNTFANGEVWINNDQVKTIIENDGYRPLADGENPQQGDVGIYAEGKNFKLSNTQHSVLVNTVSSDGEVSDVVTKGGITNRATMTTQKAWDSSNNQNDKKNTQLQYFTKRVKQ